MAAPLAHVIKKSHVDSSKIEATDPSMLPGARRIPRAAIASDTPVEDEIAKLLTKRRLRSSESRFVAEPIEVFTANLENIRLPKSALHAGVEESQPTVEEAEALWREQLEREVEHARLEGFENGKRAAEVDMQEQLDQAKRRFAEDLNAIGASWESHLRRCEPHLVQLALRLARTILDAPLPEEVRRISETAIADAVERMANGVPVDVILHPVSYLRMQESGIVEQLSSMHSRLRWRTDPETKQNEWIVQSSRAATRRLEAELLDQLTRELSLPDLHRTDVDASESADHSDENLRAGSGEPGDDDISVD